ncbi:MAG: signal peptidase I [Gemmatimonadota bacterium]
MAKKDKGRARGEKAGEPASTKDAARARRERRGKEKPADPNSLAEWGKSIAVAVALFLFLRTFLVQTFVITSGSMEATLLVGDMLLVNRVAIGSRIPGTSVRIPGYSTPERGDVLVFDPPHEPDLMLIKRLVGVPGDTLEMRERVLYLNGVAQDEPYVVHDGPGDDVHPWMVWQRDHLIGDGDPVTYAPTRDNWGPLEIPEDRYFMLGDNREHSLDSRYWGLLEGWRLEGRAVFTYYSYNKDSYRPLPALREVRWGRIGRGIS